MNGALVLQERQLAHGDQVQIGPLVFEVQIERESAATVPSDSSPEAVTLGAENTAELDLSQPPATISLNTGEAGVDDGTKQQPAIPERRDEA